MDIKYIQDTLFVISGKWKLPILIAIYDGVYRFRDIQRYVGDVTAKVLSNYLKDLENNKLIVRKVLDEYPVRVEYHLTDYAYSLDTIMRLMVDWGKNHREVLNE